MTEMEIEEGKVYKRRDGLKAFGVVVDYELASYSVERDGKIRRGVVFANSGRANHDTKLPHADDLIEEWKEEKMPKFQVGDFVTADGWSNQKGHEIKKIDDGRYWFANSKGGIVDYSIDYWDSKLKLVTQTPKSPVVEKTVKSIEPGVYGIVTVGKIMSHGETIQVDLNKISKDFGATAEELESAAKTFMELAKYLRGR